MKEWRQTRLTGIVVIVGLLAALEGVVRAGLVNAALVPPPTEIAVRLGSILVSGSFVPPMLKTLYLLFLGFLFATILGVLLGILMGRSRTVYRLFEPIVELLRPLPKPALLPPLMLFLGLGLSMKVTIVALAVFFPILLNTIQGVFAVDRTLIDVGRTFGHGPLRIMFRVVLPAAMPMILAGMRVGLALGLILVVLAEMLAGTGGIGYLILDMQRTFRATDMYAWLVILAVIGYFLNWTFVSLERKFVHW